MHQGATITRDEQKHSFLLRPPFPLISLLLLLLVVVLFKRQMIIGISVSVVSVLHSLAFLVLALSAVVEALERVYIFHSVAIVVVIVIIMTMHPPPPPPPLPRLMLHVLVCVCTALR